MIEAGNQFYLYALYAVMICAIASFVAIIRILKNSRVPIRSIELFNIYFIIGVVGWIILAIKDTNQLDIDFRFSVILYIFCSYILLLAVGECSKQKRATLFISLLHSIVILLSLFLSDDKSRLLYISTYVVIIYPVISFIAIKRAYQTENIGGALIGITALINATLSLVQIYMLIVLSDVNLAYGIGLIANSTGFILVGIGFVTSILITKHKQLKSLTLKDPLTGLLNRRGMEESLNVSLAAASRSRKWFSAIAIDIDFFKKINDTYGHDAGDKVLQELGAVLSEYTRTQDVCCRLGGEEFVIVQPDTSMEVAVMVAERIREHIEKLEVPYENKLIKLTSSLGVASFSGDVDIDHLLKNADKALYQSKYEGRNKVSISN